MSCYWLWIKHILVNVANILLYPFKKGSAFSFNSDVYCSLISLMFCVFEHTQEHSNKNSYWSNQAQYRSTFPYNSKEGLTIKYSKTTASNGGICYCLYSGTFVTTCTSIVFILF